MMDFRMHDYGDGRTGLAAFCGVCGKQITENGYVLWDSDDRGSAILIHQGRCDPGSDKLGSSMPLDVELVHLANSASIDLDEAREHAARLSGL